MNTKTSSADPANCLAPWSLGLGRLPWKCAWNSYGHSSGMVRTELKALMLLIRRNAIVVRAEVWVERLTGRSHRTPLPQPWFRLLPDPALAAPPCSGSSFPSLEWHKWGETGLAGHSRDPVTQLMRERKQFIAPNKCYSTSIRQPPLLLPLTLTFRFCTTANSDFKLFLLPDSASLWAGVNLRMD